MLGRRRDLMGVCAPVEKEVRWRSRCPSIDFGSEQKGVSNYLQQGTSERKARCGETHDQDQTAEYEDFPQHR